MRYCVLYPNAENVHLIKDVGMIAYKLHRLYGWDVSVASYENDNYSYVNNVVKGLKIDFIKRKYGNDILDGLRYLKDNAEALDILQIFHITLRSVFYAFAFKLYNKKGKIFLKLDCTDELIKVISGLNNIKRIFLNKFLSRVDIIGVEQKRLYEELESLLPEFKHKLAYVPNGIDYDSANINDSKSVILKENIILTVSRLGSPEKDTEMLLKAFSMINMQVLESWKLVLVGPIENNFKIFLEDFLKHHPRLREKIILKGPLFDREALYSEYRKAKIFCLSSKYESFGIALLEGAAFGDVIISTDVGIAGELVQGSDGAIVQVGDSAGLARELEKFLSRDNLMEISLKTMQFCKDNFDWDNIVSNLSGRLIK